MNDFSKTIWTVGHSTRTLAEFADLLQLNRIEILADVRRFPGSRKNPHFGKEPLGNALSQFAIAYVPFPELGGMRKPHSASANTAWRNPSFRGYADYMESQEFHAGIARLLQFAERGRTAFMCSEAVWWRCHRALIADFLKVSGWQVIHILGAGKTELHPYTSAAKVIGDKLSYSEKSELFES